MSRPRLLDLFCGAGGAAMGYHRAGFEVVGVDLEPMPRYPFEFHQGDALTYPLEGFAAVHASPPCQGYTSMNHRYGSSSPLLIAETRRRLEGSGLPYVIENVSGALAHMRSPISLSGGSFGVGVNRPRLFESSVLLLAPARGARVEGGAAVYGRQDGRRLWTRADGSELRVADLATAREAMGIEWMEWDEIREAIPPAYTEWIGEQLLRYLEVAA